MQLLISELLSNQLVVGALAVLIATGIHALSEWIKSKTPAGMVENYWSYLQPVIEAGLKVIDEKAKAGELTNGAIDILISKTLDEFAKKHATLERKDMSDALVIAARNEIIETYTAYMAKLEAK